MDIILRIIILLVLVSICISDLKTNIISNKKIIVLIFAVFLHCHISESYINLIWFLPVIFFGMLTWSLGCWGAGDAKLMAALSPLINHENYIFTLVLVLALGCVQVLLMIAVCKLSGMNFPKKIAYGVPISLGCMTVFFLQ
ncbi:prepilin peptidase [Vibrio hannami]|uniref:prepilin peptidase n=1 Tax=Vibrio hannami TaxID=2717094 RepID=UPI00240E9FFE|nr:prepilin peptidase [Vibrio hannami]MDG3085981.1 prepilin peptidase [Vibrio hannami]